MTQLTIRRFQYLSAAKFGCLAGVIIMTLPALICSITTLNSINALLGWILSVSILELPGILPDLNLLQILNLADFVASLQSISDLGWLFVLGVSVVSIGAGAAWVTAVALLNALLYNVVATFSGGLSFTAETQAQPGGRAAQGPVTKGVAVAPVAPAAQVAVSWLRSSSDPRNSWPIRAGRTAFGSAAGNDHIIKGIAGRHAEIQAEDGRLAFYDRSGGQSWINGKPVGQGVWLKSTDTIRMGPYDFILEDQPAAK